MKRSIRLTGLLTGILIVCPVALRAQDGDEQAKQLFATGVAQFEARDYEDAVQSFREAYARKPSWKIQFNIGQCEAALKNYGAAMDAFEAYLAEGGDDIPPDRRAEVTSEIAELSAMVGYLELEAAEGSRISVNGLERGVAPLSGRIRVSVGREHDVAAQLPDGTTVQRRVKVGTGEQLLVNLTARDTAEPPGTTGGVGQVHRSTRGTIGWVAVGVGGAALIAGIATGSTALRNNADIKDNCPDGVCGPAMYDTVDRTEALALATDILLPVGGAAVVVGVLLLTVFREKNSPVALMPAGNARGAGVAMEWRF
jgi:hypothetical protein